MSSTGIHWEDYRVRPVRRADQDRLHALLKQSTDQLSTLPTSVEGVEKCIRKSIHSFHPDVVDPGDEIYFLVLEHLPTKAILGVGAVHARIGGFAPFYTFQVQEEKACYAPLNIERTVTVLSLTKRHSGPSELGSLYLHPDHRGGGLGRFLSLSRLMLVLSMPHRFQSSIIAEIRGWHDDHGNSPFWERVAKAFYGGDFKELDTLSGTGEKQFIEALLPRHAIYLDLLSPEVRRVVGRPNDAAVPAMRILHREGFHEVQEVDIFDAGPTIQAQIEDLRLKRELSSRVDFQNCLPSGTPSTPFIVSTGIPGFQCCIRNGCRLEAGVVVQNSLPTKWVPSNTLAAPLFAQ